MKVRIMTEKVGRLTFYRPQVLKTKTIRFLLWQRTYSQWVNFSAYRHCGRYYVPNDDNRVKTYQDALDHIKALSAIWNEDYEIVEEEG